MSDNTQKLIAILSESAEITKAIAVCHRHCPNGYVAGGALTQTVWNVLTDQPETAQIKDIDIVYFDPATDLAAEKQLEAALNARRDVKLPLDLTNEAITHTWYAAKFGYAIAPYQSTEDAIDTWLPAFAVGVRQQDEGLSVYAPYGLDDLFSMTIRPNKRQIRREVYEDMAASYVRRWPTATVCAW